MYSSTGRHFGLLNVSRSAELLGLSVHQMYRFAAEPPPGFPPALPRRKGQRLLFSSVLIEAWLAGQDVSSGALPNLITSVPPVANRSAGRPRNGLAP